VSIVLDCSNADTDWEKDTSLVDAQVSLNLKNCPLICSNNRREIVTSLLDEAGFDTASDREWRDA
jgi:hypothetical protein